MRNAMADGGRIEGRSERWVLSGDLHAFQGVCQNFRCQNESQYASHIHSTKHFSMHMRRTYALHLSHLYAVDMA
jgi:hypothetical protein